MKTLNNFNFTFKDKNKGKKNKENSKDKQADIKQSTKKNNDDHNKDEKKATQKYNLPDTAKDRLNDEVKSYLANKKHVENHYENILNPDPMQEHRFAEEINKQFLESNRKNNKELEAIRRKSNAKFKQAMSLRYDARYFDSIKVIDRYIKLDNNLNKATTKDSDFTF
ncbi:hypothetical protein DY037_05360 [Apilactobacillus micheneri]|uniref:hypothetical protein n=1 Tax=Apilactobacillus micheneri TaxID=1899430 RepID=UPI0011291058|nr:hypothetical protein [Apilactobacillus micheneri]TPR49208.1 hypothetical protein DY037_05360 [Apilactobacillus micheneri]